MTKTNFKKVATKYGYVWLEKNGRFILEKHYGEYVPYRIWDRTPKFTEKGYLSYDNIEEACDFTIPKFTTITEVDAFLSNTEELNRIYKAIDERFGMEFKPF